MISRAPRGKTGQQRGAPMELVGRPIPGDLTLPRTGTGAWNLGAAAAGTLLLYSFASVVPERTSGALTDCVLACYVELRALDVAVAGISGEPVPLLEALVDDCELPFGILSDPHLQFAGALGLSPAMCHSGHYEPLVLVAQAGTVASVWRPQPTAAVALTAALAWLQDATKHSTSSQIGTHGGSGAIK